MRSATLDPCLEITCCQVLSCKNKAARKIFLLFSLPPSFSYTRTSTPTHTCACACTHARTHKKLLFWFSSPSFFVQLQIADVLNFRAGFNFIWKWNIWYIYIILKKRVIFSIAIFSPWTDLGIQSYYKFPPTSRAKMINSLRTHSVDFSFTKWGRILLFFLK